jgi:hypothetical protein
MGILSWSGRGLIVLPLLFLPVLLLSAMERWGADAAMIGFYSGSLLAGLICLALGKMWNKEGPLHTFGKLRMETWGYILIAWGLLNLIMRLVGGIRAILHPPLKLKTFPRPQFHPATHAASKPATLP